MGLYQDLEASSGSRNGAGNAIDSIHRQYSPDGKVRGEGMGPGVRPGISTSLAGLHNKHGENNCGANTGTGVPRLNGKNNDSGTKSSTSENKEIVGGVSEIIGGEQTSARALFRLISKLNAANQVILPASMFYKHLQMHLSAALIVANHDYETTLTLPLDSMGGVDLVGQSYDQMEWKDGTMGGAQPDHRIRCVESGMGNILRGCQHKRPLVDTRKELVHKLPRAASSCVSTENLHKEQDVHVSIVKNRQHIAVAYITNHERTVSKELVSLTRDL